MSGPFEFLHIKGRTEGSSNELSFDVLDAARSDADNQKNRNVKPPPGVKPSQGSYHGVTGTSTFSAAPEVARRKKVRRAHSLKIFVGALLAVIVFVGAGTFFVYQYLSSKNDFNGRFNGLIEKLVEIDTSMMDIDSLMQDPVKLIDVHASSNKEEDMNGSTSSTLSDALVAIPSVRRELNSIAAESQSMKEIATQDAEKAALSQIESACKARLDMIDAVDTASGVAADASKRVIVVNDAWNRVIDADGMVRAATDLTNEADSEEKIIEARKETEKARELLMQAKEIIHTQESLKPKINFTEESRYLDKRAEALAEAVKTANYVLIHNREGAEKANDSYNEADKEAASLALKLPDSEGEKIVEAYRTELEKAGKEYERGRAAASTADSAVRSYQQRT